MNRYSYQK